jgi:DNA-binding NtrC family response regulator
VLLRGETGTGKELVARALHAASPRRAGPFVVVHCGAIPEGLFESELFGHERGAFTGAVTAKPGRFELAHGGTIFLDEVGELPVAVQVKLLRALQERTIDRVGGVKPVEVDVRVIAATHRDLVSQVAAGAFREDLYYRLAVVPIALPPLRERVEDLAALLDHFLARHGSRLGREVRGFHPDALARLAAHDWPGNVRELENLVERCLLLADGDWITRADLGLDGRDGADPGTEPAADLDLKQFLRLHTARLERERIRIALDATGGNVTHSARALGISRKSLQTKMKEHGLRESDATEDGGPAS